ncbi:methionine adenosyltransferase [Spirochaeta thermophila]|uniref:S-adenosylmethionine synthase n=1 Tax=Winmispira thermophila (strain ATCC 49972 / DSM 6192 / RI 19.B1) TaxID=665571 RepID=E0RTC3_WINT6|nr:methionine adenosyltransferase [Spirochaeta thermophila]ADN00989.1 S-adenosylmethionine synthetase [Spirochaeta thermophila DSM 6192]
MSLRRYLFSSESVSEGHPDKIADQVSDAVLDACLAQDPESRVACEVFTTTGMVLVGGEIASQARIDVQELVREVVKEIGYDRAEYGLDYRSMSVVNVLQKQSPDIAQGVLEGIGLFKERGAGDQGMMFGFACDETPELMPMPIMCAHRLLQHAARLRKEGVIPWLRPDAKSQVTVEYEGWTPKRITAVVLSHQHDDGLEYEEIRTVLIDQVIRPVLEPTGLLDESTVYYINPTGRFVIGGPHGDTGLTGRKLMVDTYGGMARHGGGAFSGKDPTKVDRSAAYMARYIAKNIVAAGLAKRCEIQVSYAIGVPRPVSIMVDTFGTGEVSDRALEEAIDGVFDLSPEGIIRTLDLQRPLYRATAVYGHFGREEFPWERVDKVEEIRRAVGM